MKQRIERYIQQQLDNMKKTPIEGLEQVCQRLLLAREQNKTIYMAGNGGSASTAGHFTNDLVKGLSMAEKKRFKSFCLCDQTAVITALANDYDYSRIFSEQLINYGQKGDVLVVISGSGNSPNIIKAMECAKEMGMTVIGLTGKTGGKVKEMADIAVCASTDHMEKIEDLHMFWEHTIITTLKDEITNE